MDSRQPRGLDVSRSIAKPKLAHGARRARASLVPAVAAAAAAVVALVFVVGCGSGGSSGTTNSSASGTSSQTTGAQSTPATTTTGTTTTGTTTPSGTTTGGGSTAPSTGPSKPKESLPAIGTIELTSPAVKNEGVLPATYTCDGQNTPPAMYWKAVPAGTRELMLDVIKISPVNHKLYFAWSVTGIPTSTHSIVGGKLPAGAVVGTNSAGQTRYDLCPAKGTNESYVAVLFALTKHLAAQPGYDATTLRHEAEHTAKYQAFLIFRYPRK